MSLVLSEGNENTIVMVINRKALSRAIQVGYSCNVLSYQTTATCTRDGALRLAQARHHLKWTIRRETVDRSLEIQFHCLSSRAKNYRFKPTPQSGHYCMKFQEHRMYVSDSESRSKHRELRRTRDGSWLRKRECYGMCLGFDSLQRARVTKISRVKFAHRRLAARKEWNDRSRVQKPEHVWCVVVRTLKEGRRGEGEWSWYYFYRSPVPRCVNW